MIDADRYHHTGRTYVNIFRAHLIGAISYLGLTPQAMDLAPLRGFTLWPKTESHTGLQLLDDCVVESVGSPRRINTI